MIAQSLATSPFGAVRFDRQGLELQLGQRRAQLPVAAEDDGALDEVLQLADIARPGVTRHRLQRFRRNASAPCDSCGAHICW